LAAAQTAKFHPKSHQRFQQQPKSQQAADGVICEAEFKHLQELTGGKFTWDMNCNSVDFSRCNNPASAFVDSDLCNHHVLLHPHVSQAEQCIEHLFTQWSKEESKASACIVLPQSLSYLVNCFDGFARIVMKYPNRSRILQSASSGKLYRTSQPLQAYHLPAKHDVLRTQEDILTMLNSMNSDAETISASDDLLKDPSRTKLAFVYDVTCFALAPKAKQGPIPATLMGDSGATSRFASLDWVKLHKLPIKATHNNWKVKVANDEIVSIVGTVDIQVNIQGYKDKIRFLVMPMSPDFDIILGNDWFHK